MIQILTRADRFGHVLRAIAVFMSMNSISRRRHSGLGYGIIRRNRQHVALSDFRTGAHRHLCATAAGTINADAAGAQADRGNGASFTWRDATDQ